MSLSAIAPITSALPQNYVQIVSVVSTQNPDGTISITTTYGDGSSTIITSAQSASLTNAGAQQWVNPSAVANGAPPTSLIWLSA